MHRPGLNILLLILLTGLSSPAAAADNAGARLFETKVRPILVKHCYDCHSEAAGERRGGLLLDRESGWLKGGDTENAVVRGEPDASLLIRAVRYRDEKLQMPPKYRLADEEIRTLERWVASGASGPADDMGQTKFSQLGDQDHLFGRARGHWAFHPVSPTDPPAVDDPLWNRHPIDRFVYHRLQSAGLKPSRNAKPRTLIRRLTHALTGLPPSAEEVAEFERRAAKQLAPAYRELVDELLQRDGFGEHLGRLWLDVARYADTESTYRADTKTPHYLPYAFTYRDYVIRAFNEDKPYDRFLTEQLAADRLGLADDAPELAALGFLSIGPHRRNQDEAIDDWIDVTTRGLLGLSVACARCHDHKYEPVPTADYYSLHGVFASVSRPNPLNEKAMPVLTRYEASAKQAADYRRVRKKIDAEIEGAGEKVARNNRRSIAQKIRETKLAELLLHHDGAPARAMVVGEARRPVDPYVFVRGERRNRGERVPRRFLRVLDAEQKPFSADDSGRLDLARRLTDPRNPLTARVFVNRVWGHLTGGHLVDTPSDFGLQGGRPSHPELLDWLADDFVRNGWSVKRLVKQIVTSWTFQQRSDSRADGMAADPENRLLWRAHRRHLGVEALRDGLLFAAGRLERRMFGRAGPLWGEDHSPRRSVYGFINRFNLDPTLRAFDFPSAMTSAAGRGESIVAQQALFTMNSPFVIRQAVALTESADFRACADDGERLRHLFSRIFQREPLPDERARSLRFVELQSRFYNDPDAPISSPWPLVAQALFMSNEFQYVD